MPNIEKAFSNITKFFDTHKNQESKIKFWLNCLRKIEPELGSNRLFERIANAPKSDLSDYLAELWFAVFFKYIGFELTIEPFGDGPDMKITRNGFEIFVEVTCFRTIYEGPPELSLLETADFELVEYGNIKRDIKKAYTKITNKFSQLKRSEITSAIIAVWNYDGDLEEIEMGMAIENIQRDYTAGKIQIPKSLKFIVFAPWDGQQLVFNISNSLTPAEKQLAEDFSKYSIIEVQQKILLSS